MIDEQHRRQISLYPPMDIKCHATAQQLLQQQQQTAMLMGSGNERMLTTSTTTTSTGLAAAASTAAPASLCMGGSPKSNESPLNGKHGPSLNNTTNTMPTTRSPTTGTTTAATANATNVNGSCQSQSSRNSNKTNSNSNDGSRNQQQATNAAGPGPPQTNMSNIMAMNGGGGGGGGGRVALGEYSLNGGGGMMCPSNGALCVNNNNNHAYLMRPQMHSPQIHEHTVMVPPSPMLCSISAVKTTQCGYCGQPICDRYILRVADTSYHEGCLKCVTCALHLVHSCFARDGKLYCRIDYESLFIRNCCLGCGHKIASDELVMRTLENVFHLKCFACVVCGALLKKGEQYVVKQGQLFCRFDYEKEVEMLQGYDFYGDDFFPPKLDGRRGPKRPRTILNTQQRRAFKASFEVSPKPCRKVRENLAKETGLSLRIVQVWFQNQRAKVKKIQKKAKQENIKGASDSQDSQDSDNSHLKIKSEAHSDNETLLESPYSSCGTGSGGGTSSDAMIKVRCREDTEGMSFNFMETNKENCNKTNEPILNTILGLSYATFQQLMGPFTQSPMINPIDRLYSMQNSYFRPEELGGGGYGEGIKDTAGN